MNIKNNQDFDKYFNITCFSCDEEPDMIPFKIERKIDIGDEDGLPFRYDCPNCDNIILIFPCCPKCRSQNLKIEGNIIICNNCDDEGGDEA